MTAIEPLTLIALVTVAFVAGCIDAIAGGGGLLTVPALALAGVDPRTALATNKLQSSFGSASATLAFARAGLIERRTGRWFAIAAATGSVLGALTLSHVPQSAAAVALPFVLLAVAVYFAVSPRLGEADRHRRVRPGPFIGLIIPAIGFYDGVFGPRAGSFYVAACVGLFGLGIVRATAHIKAANLASNLAALATLSLSGHVLWGLGLAMGAGQFAGARVGSGLALRHGGRLVKPLLIAVSLTLAVKLALAPDHPIRHLLTGAIG